ncbi:HAD-IIB family hydrolase [Xenorhabdus bovienii]|uniref:Sucrose phosphatase-like domain-containing protein n=1 Tax=Xenorhabdus bovienii TaxID=40576 RepID=A0A0B6XB69_XENBV|nr:HAD-IIB family hydrolase [Xenorhabdus bovienii]CDM90770.1 conserved protein of unknown function [Xenorhabdus bovienii]
MNFLTEILPPEFPCPVSVKTLVCCDLDETYIPFSLENKPFGGVRELEQFLCEEGKKKGILLGWITGTNLSSAIRKAKGYISRSPHFLCCSLGTEFYWVRNGKLVPSVSWAERIKKSGYNRENVEKILYLIGEKGIFLEKQPDDYQGKYKASFYYHIREDMESDFEWIESIAKTFQIRTFFTKSNPAAGDPEDCYDVEFIPYCCGKGETVSFLMEKMHIPRNSVLAFGDSCNDLPMFECVGHSYLVANAEKTAIQKHGSNLNKPYCHGILSVLTGL